MSMRYKLYNREGSGGFVVEAALTLAGAPFDLMQLDTLPGTPLPDSFRSVNPWRQVPTLVMRDGTTMTETAAILLHLAACYPDKALAPPPATAAHGQLMRWMIFASVNIYEALLRSAYPDRYTLEGGNLDAVRQAAVKRMGEGLSLLEAQLETGPFILGPEQPMSVADLYVAMLFCWSKAHEQFPRLASMTDAVRHHPVVAPIWLRHFGNR